MYGQFISFIISNIQFFWMCSNSFLFFVIGLKDKYLIIILFDEKMPGNFFPWITKHFHLSDVIRELLQYYVTLCILQIIELFHIEKFLITGSIKERSILYFN